MNENKIERCMSSICGARQSSLLMLTLTLTVTFLILISHCGQVSGDNMLAFRQQLMYPYNLNDFTEITSSKPIHYQSLPFRLPFFGFSYHYVLIQRDGYLAFNRGLLWYKFPMKFPATPIDPLLEEDPSIIAPWFALQDIPTEVANAGVYLKIVNLESEYNVTLRERIYMDFSEGMIGAADFRPKFALIITWRNMTMVNRRPEKPLVTNTYQCVVATDEIRTYAMFNYEQIEWITHQDNYVGLKGYAAYVGFNAGNTTRTFEFRPYSQNPRISYLTTRGWGNSLRGRHYFQIDEEVWPGACIEKDLNPYLPDRMPLTFFPRVGHMLGGTLVNFTGPCLAPDSIITCKFENWRTVGTYRDVNHATCITPPVMYNGYVDFTVTVDDRTLFLGRFYIQPPEISDDDVVVLNGDDRLEDPKQLQIKWKSTKLGWNGNARVTMSLWGFRETNDVYPKLHYIDVLADPGSLRLGQLNTTLDLSLYRNRTNPHINDTTFGFIAINLTDPTILGTDITESPVIYSRPMPLAWYFKTQWEREFGDNGQWKQHFCEDWSLQESHADRIDTTHSSCPCTLPQAMLDCGRFTPDLECNIVDRVCDTFHRGAQHCVLTGTPSLETAEFTLIHVDNSDHKFDVEGRFEPVPRSHRTDPLINATKLTAVVARDNMSSIVKFRVRPDAARWRYHMYVIVDKEYVFWWHESMRMQTFRCVTLYQPNGIENMSTVIAMFDSGAGVEVHTNQGHMTVHVYASNTFLNETAGLLGRYSSDYRDDFTLPSGQQISVQSQQNIIHAQFGMAWRAQERVSAEQQNSVMWSLFFHDTFPYAYYDDPNFMPDFALPPQLPDYAMDLQTEMMQICSDSVACQYDYVITLDRNFAKITKQHEDLALWLSNETNNKILRCPSLAPPLNGFKSSNRYWVGTIVRFSCYDGYRLVGSESRRCQEDGVWSSSGVDPECIK